MHTPPLTPAHRIHQNIVYCGPVGAGKTTNLLKLREEVEKKGLNPSPTEEVPIGSDVAINFSFDLKKGFAREMHFLISTLCGKKPDFANWQSVLYKVSGIIFVADSEQNALSRNFENLAELKRNLRGMRRDLDEIPVVIQHNKSDLADSPAEDRLFLLSHLFKELPPVVNACAHEGIGVFETFDLLREMLWVEELFSLHEMVAI